MNKKYIVRLTQEERDHLDKLLSVGRTAARKLLHARVLLKADADGPAWQDERIAEALDTSVSTIEIIRQRFVEEGFEAALNRKKQVRPSVTPKLDGEKEAQLIALSCSSPPDGRARWTLRLLADRLVTLEVVESISHETVRQVMKKTS
jgi:transposase